MKIGSVLVQVFLFLYRTNETVAKVVMRSKNYWSSSFFLVQKEREQKKTPGCDQKLPNMIVAEKKIFC